MGEPSPVVEFYSGRDVLVTGATGFLGKILVEKLLFSVPSVRSVFLLIRPQKGQSAVARLETIRASRVFQRLREAHPTALAKLRAVEGDLMERELGLSPSDRSLLSESVSVVFHCAATVKFDEALRISVNMNVVGTQRLVALCHQMRHLVAVVHASTAYANCDRRVILETVYPPPVNPSKVIEAFEWMSDDMVTALTPSLVGRRPNTYTLTKALAEFVLVEESGSLPTIIIRPSIIGASWREPEPGWVDNLNGPTGLFIAVAKGLLRTMSGDEMAKADIVPVDVVANLLIISAFHRARSKSTDIPVINCCSGTLNPLRWGQILHSLHHFHRHPVEGIYRVPSWGFTKNRTYRHLSVFANHMGPAYVADGICRLIGKRPRLVRLYSKLFRAVESLEFFTSGEWEFQSKGLPGILEGLGAADRATFDCDLRRVDWPSYLEDYHHGCKTFMLGQTAKDAPAARAHYDRVALWSRVLKASAALLLLRIASKRSGGLRRFWWFLVSVLARLIDIVKAPFLPLLSN